MIDRYIKRDDHADEDKWSDAKLVEWHNDIVDFLDGVDLTPRIIKRALGELACVRYEIEKRIEDIGLEVEEY